MADNSTDRLTLARRFLEPANSTHRRYEALRAFLVEQTSSAEAAARFGYTPGSFRVLVHQFRKQPDRDFFAPTIREGRPPGEQKRLRERVITLRKQNLSVHEISRALAGDGESLSPAAIAALLKEEGFAKLPRRGDDERPDQPRPLVADVAYVRQLDLTPRFFLTKFGGLFLFLPWIVSADLPELLTRSGFPGSKMVPAPCAVRSLLALKLFGNARHSHVMSAVLDEGLALFAGLNVVPKRSFLTEYSCRVAPACYPKLMRDWFDAVSRLGLKWGTRSRAEGDSR
jgi:transposase